MKNVTIFGSLLSANFRKVQAVSYELGLKVDVEEVNVYEGAGKSEAYLKQNRLGQIPILVDEKIVLRESNAIIVYLSEKYGDCFLYGSTPGSRAEINQWLFWESSQWQPLLATIMGSHVGNKLLPAVIPKPTDVPDWKSDPCVNQLSFLNKHLESSWLASSKPTLADFSVAAMSTYFKVSHFPFAAYPNIAKWLDRLSHLHSWQETAHPLWNLETC